MYQAHQPPPTNQPETRRNSSDTPACLLRQVIEWVNQTFKAQLGLERYGGHTPAEVMV
jgi:hypothetical protein